MKGAVHAFTKVLAKEVGVHSVTVNAIAPCATYPDGQEAISTGSRWHPDGVFAQLMAERAEELVSIARRTVLERQFAFPAEIGAAAVYLASDAAAFVTGQVLSVGRRGYLVRQRPHPATELTFRGTSLTATVSARENVTWYDARREGGWA